MKWYRMNEQKPAEDKEYLVVVNTFEHGVKNETFLSRSRWDPDEERWRGLHEGGLVTHWAEIIMPKEDVK